MSEQNSNDGSFFSSDSGAIVLIDQFMLGNDQLLTLLRNIECGSEDEAERSKLRDQLVTYGGTLLKLKPGRYCVQRDPYKSYMVICRVGDVGTSVDEVDEGILEEVSSHESASPLEETVFIDTRCLVFMDASLLDDRKLLSQYRSLRKRAMDKKARDLLRQSGASVRYGFDRDGDELSIFPVTHDTAQFALKPVAEHH